MKRQMLLTNNTLSLNSQAGRTPPQAKGHMFIFADENENRIFIWLIIEMRLRTICGQVS